MEIQCSHAECRNTFEVPPRTHISRMYRLLGQSGWSRRGSVTGAVYFCAVHPPSGRADPLAQCDQECLEVPLANFLGHDEIGHRAAYGLLEYFARDAADPERLQRSGEPVERVRAMTENELRGIAEIGETERWRIRHVLQVRPNAIGR